MAVTFLEPGGDATFNVASTTAGGFWQSVGGNTLATDFVHGSHQKSIKVTPAMYGGYLYSPTGIAAASGTRVSFYVYIDSYDTLAGSVVLFSSCYGVGISTTGELQLVNNSGTLIGTAGTTLNTGTWYRVSVAHTATSTTVNEIRVWVDGAITINESNLTISSISFSAVNFGTRAQSGSGSYRYSDMYVDNDSSLTDTKNIWVTAKRPNTNGTLNEFTTQIGAGGSGYGSGHSPQVNERPTSTTNGWSIANGGVVKVEQYNIEGLSTGDIDISNASIVDYIGWTRTSRGNPGTTGNMILNGVTSGGGFSDTDTIRTVVAGSSTYPGGTGSDIGVTTSTTSDTYNLHECGILFAYIPTYEININQPKIKGVKIL